MSEPITGQPGQAWLKTPRERRALNRSPKAGPGVDPEDAAIFSGGQREGEGVALAQLQPGAGAGRPHAAAALGHARGFDLPIH